MPRMVEVPENCKAILVTDQMLEHYGDWVTLAGPSEMYALQARAVPTDNPLVMDIEARYVEAESGSE